MGFKKEAPVLEKPETPAAAEALSPKEDKAPVSQKRDNYTPDEKKVRGQVRMHALKCGYEVAAQLAPTLASTAAGIKDELHKLALEVAEKVEVYSFLGGK